MALTMADVGIKDPEYYVYDAVADQVKEEYGSKVWLTSEYTESPSQFPAVSIIQVSSYDRADRRTSFVIQNGVKLLYEVNVYSNLAGGVKKIQAKEIAEYVRRSFAILGFICTIDQPVPNFASTSIYRILMRFEASIGPDNHIYAP